ncbi:hypothetical protein Pryu01_03060 [Paraliobacillus ryukyuensis]|uniref:Phi13 family phage major tail protein n=1 Tax=Paraliobacillus ryukyuensis TaxID=200904 RepID=A0A366DQC2_9BACI|nr:phi13 family phage major tail protein [Paraliobacillus ryukyuensis]
MAEEKVQFGLKNVHYAPYTVNTDGTISFGNPKPIPGGVEMTNEALGDPIVFYADNMKYYQADNNQGYEGTLTISRLPDAFRQDILKEELDGTDKVMSEYADVQTQAFALMFQFENDSKARRHVMYNCNAQRPSISSSTKTDSTEVSTTELSYSASPVVMNGRPIVKTSTTFETPDAVYNGWFQSVYTNTPVSVTGVTLEPATFSLAVGDYQQLATTIEPINATNQDVTYTTSDDTVATVTSGGLVEGIAAGTATITVTTEDGTFTDTSDVTVS